MAIRRKNRRDVKESLGKYELNQRGNPRKRSHDLDGDEALDKLVNSRKQDSTFFD